MVQNVMDPSRNCAIYFHPIVQENPCKVGDWLSRNNEAKAHLGYRISGELGVRTEKLNKRLRVRGKSRK